VSTLLSPNIVMRPYAGEADLPAIAELLNACEAVDRVDIGTSVDELRQEFAHPNLGAAHNICLWQDHTTIVYTKEMRSEGVEG